MEARCERMESFEGEAGAADRGAERSPLDAATCYSVYADHYRMMERQADAIRARLAEVPFDQVSRVEQFLHLTLRNMLQMTVSVLGHATSPVD